MKNRVLLIIAISVAAIFLISGTYYKCPFAAFPAIHSDSAANIYSSDYLNDTKYISGIVIDSRGYLVIAPFRVILRNLDMDKFKDGGTFQEGRFNVSFDIPSFATENDTLRIEITSTDGKIKYGNTTLLLTYLNSTTTYEVEVLIVNPPPSYSWVWVIIFVLAFGLILAGYAIFTRWLIGKIILRRADQIRLEEWKRKGGGQMQR